MARGRPKGRAQANQERILQLAQSGQNDAQIAATLNLSVNYVGQLRNLGGLRLPRGVKWPPEKLEAMREEVKAGRATIREIADREGVTPKHLHSLLGKLGRIGGSRVNREKVRVLALSGKNDEEISEELHLSVLYVAQLRRRAGIRRRRLPKRSPEEIGAIRRLILEEELTLKQAGELEGLSGERIRQLAGNSGRKSNWKSKPKKIKKLELLRQLFEAGKTDGEIAAKTELSPRAVSSYRREMRLLRPNPLHRHTVESSIRFAQLWSKEYGFTPGVADWTPSLAAQAQQDHQVRIQRLEKFSAKYGRPPVQFTVRLLFGSWPEFIRQAGLPQVPRGRKAHGRFKVEKAE